MFLDLQTQSDLNIPNPSWASSYLGYVLLKVTVETPGTKSNYVSRDLGQVSVAEHFQPVQGPGTMPSIKKPPKPKQTNTRNSGSPGQALLTGHLLISHGPKQVTQPSSTWVGGAVRSFLSWSYLASTGLMKTHHIHCC